MMVNDNGNGSQPPIFTVAGSNDPASFAGGPSDGLTHSDALKNYSTGLIGDVTAYLMDFVMLPATQAIVISTWILASWVCDCWEKFPMLGITSPEMRCGKTTLLGLISRVTPKSARLASTSPSSLFRTMDNGNIITILIDEAQSLNKKNDNSALMIEILSDSVQRGSSTQRSVRKNGDFEPKQFKTYGPKVLACIGKLDPVLADRCLPITMRRKGVNDKVRPARDRDIKPIAESLNRRLYEWSNEAQASISKVYDVTDYLPIEGNDRLADGLLPLQAVLTWEDLDHSILQTYADEIERANRKNPSQTIHNRLLNAFREIFEENGTQFLSTAFIVSELNKREEDGWTTWNEGKGINPYNVGKYLKEYDIGPTRDSKGDVRGYRREHFEDAFSLYCQKRQYPSEME